MAFKLKFFIRPTSGTFSPRDTLKKGFKRYRASLDFFFRSERLMRIVDVDLVEPRNPVAVFKALDHLGDQFNAACTGQTVSTNRTPQTARSAIFNGFFERESPRAPVLRSRRDQLSPLAASSFPPDAAWFSGRACGGPIEARIAPLLPTSRRAWFGSSWRRWAPLPDGTGNPCPRMLSA